MRAARRAAYAAELIGANNGNGDFMSDATLPINQAALPSVNKPARLFRNFISYVGVAIAFASLTSILFLFLFELTGSTTNPYLGIFTYIIFPSILVFGLLLIPLGMLWERRRRRKLAPTDIAAFPVLDLNDPRRRRSFLTFAGLTFIFLFMSAFGSYRAFEFTESVTFCGQTCHTVMKPEYVAYKASPHARVACVECHVGPGAGWYVRSKLSGAYQLYSVTFHKYSRPIKTPVHNLRPAQETCEQCHWPEKFWGAQLKTFSHYGYDEQNSLRQMRMLIKTGGGSTPSAGVATGIHWHMNIANKITYVSIDEQRQVIPWIRVEDRQGHVTEYRATEGNQLTPEQIARMPQRRMDCVDCHNRPAHIYLPPDKAVDDALAAGRMDATLPYIKKQSVELLSQHYDTTDEALNAIGGGLDNFYRTNYAALYAQRPDAIKTAIAETQHIYQTYFFPEMRTDWQTHPNNIGHYYSVGCFRCHDGQHVSNDGRVILNDCNICHTVLDQGDQGGRTKAHDGEFRHPVALGELSNLSCATCHRANKPFQHPINLGDISQFKCVDCHAGKVWTRSTD
jgi:nitrate/TMAO reductase-like tetraheme cytochrome c subunit